MKKAILNLAKSQLSKDQMKMVTGGLIFARVCVDCYCSNGGAFGYTGGGNPAQLAHKICGNSSYVCGRVQC